MFKIPTQILSNLKMLNDSRNRHRDSETYITNINNQKRINNPLSASVPSKTVPYFTYILNTHKNDSKNLKIPFKYEINNFQQKLSSNSPRSSLNFRAKRKDFDLADKSKKQNSKHRTPSSSLHMKVHSSTVPDNVIKSLDVTSYSFHYENNDSIESKTDPHLKMNFKSNSQLSARPKSSFNKNIDQNQKNSANSNVSRHSSDGFIINKIIRGTFHSKNEIQKIKQYRLNESRSQDIKKSYNDFLKIDEDKNKEDNYKHFFDMKFSNNEKLTGTQNEKQTFHNRNESKLFYELAFEQDSESSEIQKQKIDFIIFHEKGTKTIHKETESIIIKTESINKEETESINKEETNKLFEDHK